MSNPDCINCGNPGNHPYKVVISDSDSAVIWFCDNCWKKRERSLHISWKDTHCISCGKRLDMLEGHYSSTQNKYADVVSVRFCNPCWNEVPAEHSGSI